MRVLVADDSMITRSRICGYLQTMGHECVAKAHNANEAYSMCVTHKPDIAILDILMPPGDGKTTALRLFNEKVVPCVVVVSSNTQDAMLDMLHSAGIHTIGKPLTKEKFIAKLTSFLGEKNGLA